MNAHHITPNGHFVGGWRPQKPDHRDKHLSAVRRPKLIRTSDLRGLDSPIEDQGELGSCTAHAIAGLLQFDALKEALSSQGPVSRLMIYYNERVIEGTVDQDAGAELRDGMKSVAQQGVAPETEWPYDITKFADAPPESAYKSSRLVRAIDYLAVAQTRQDLTECLANGFPVVFGFSVYDSFESDEVARTGVVPMPGPSESLRDGHAVMLVGFDGQRYIVRNSWGSRWGAKGYFYMPTGYIENANLASDFWTARVVG